MDHPIDHAMGIVPMLCDALAGLAPRGFANVELVFRRLEKGYVLAHVGAATTDGQTAWTVLDAAACTAIVNSLGNDLGADLPEWDRRVTLAREGSELVLSIGGRSARVPAAEVDAHRLFTDPVMERVTAGVPEVARRRAVFDAIYGAPDPSWTLAAEAAELTTPKGVLRAQVIAAHQEPQLHWGDATSLAAPFTRGIRELRATFKDRMYASRTWIVLEPALILPIAERAMLDLDLQRVIEWPVDDLVLFVGVA